jgi:hypothetical protein
MYLAYVSLYFLDVLGILFTTDFNTPVIKSNVIKQKIIISKYEGGKNANLEFKKERGIANKKVFIQELFYILN